MQESFKNKFCLIILHFFKTKHSSAHAFYKQTKLSCSEALLQLIYLLTCMLTQDVQMDDEQSEILLIHRKFSFYKKILFENILCFS